MQHLQAFKYALMPTREQQHRMRCFAGACRFVFNKALALQQERDERGTLLGRWACLQQLSWHIAVPPDRESPY